MRPIKFRVRNKTGTVIGYERFENAHWECISIGSLHRDGDDGYVAGTMAGSFKDQFIDQHDAKGIEIYENDRVMVPSTSGGQIPSRVRWLNESDEAGFYYGFYAVSEGKNPETRVILSDKFSKKVEVIR